MSLLSESILEHLKFFTVFRQGSQRVTLLEYLLINFEMLKNLIHNLLRHSRLNLAHLHHRLSILEHLQVVQQLTSLKFAFF